MSKNAQVKYGRDEIIWKVQDYAALNNQLYSGLAYILFMENYNFALDIVKVKIKPAITEK